MIPARPDFRTNLLPTPQLQHKTPRAEHSLIRVNSMKFSHMMETTHAP